MLSSAGETSVNITHLWQSKKEELAIPRSTFDTTRGTAAKQALLKAIWLTDSQIDKGKVCVVRP